MLYTPNPPTGTEYTGGRAGIFAEIGEHSQIIPVANSVERDQITTDLAGDGVTPSATNVLYVRRADTAGIEENAGDGWYSINPTTAKSGTPSGGTFTSSQLVVTCSIPSAPFPRLVVAVATLYGTDIVGTWDAALSTDTTSVWTDSPYFARFPATQGSVTVTGTFNLAAGASAVLRGWIGYRSGAPSPSFTASADPKYSSIAATIHRGS